MRLHVFVSSTAFGREVLRVACLLLSIIGHINSQVLKSFHGWGDGVD